MSTGNGAYVPGLSEPDSNSGSSNLSFNVTEPLQRRTKKSDPVTTGSLAMKNPYESTCCQEHETGEPDLVSELEPCSELSKVTHDVP